MGSDVLTKHPCFNEVAHDKYGRIHLPVAPRCNVQCKFCSRKIDPVLTRPGVASQILNPAEADMYVQQVLENNGTTFTAIGIAGPGDPLANPETFEAFKQLSDRHLIRCISTNGLVLPEKIDDLVRLGVRALTVSVHAVSPDVGEEIYAWVWNGGERLQGREAFELLLENQLEGVQKADRKGVVVKINTVLIPNVNEKEIARIAHEMQQAGAAIHNILPLIPCSKFVDWRTPTCIELEKARKEAGRFLPVFTKCKLCRADAVGVPGKEFYHH